MDLIKIAIQTVRKNIRFFVTLFILAIVGGVSHYFLQTESYVSNFKTNQGGVDYPLFKSLTDFKQITKETYDLPQEKIDAINDNFLKFKVSFTEETSTSISYSVVSDDELADHKSIQDDVLTLINNNIFVRNSQVNNLALLQKELDYLKGKIAQLDSMMAGTADNVSIEGIPNDAYFLYSEQLDLEAKIASIGKYELIKPVTEIKIHKRPITLFIALYIVLGGFIFLVFSKKEPKEIQEN